MRERKKIDDAMKYYNNAREINKQVGDKFMNAFILLNLSLCYRDTYQYENAIKTAEDSIAISSQLQGEKGRMPSYSLGMDMFLLDIHLTCSENTTKPLNAKKKASRRY